MADYPKAARLLRPPEFRRTYDTGQKYTYPGFVAFVAPSAVEGITRFGFTCPRALGKAVKRNRIKRRLRECVRLRRDRFPANLDVVFNPRKLLLDLPWSEVERQVDKFLERLNSSCASS
jgi:ribonuclease P protein component